MMKSSLQQLTLAIAVAVMMFGLTLSASAQNRRDYRPRATTNLPQTQGRSVVFEPNNEPLWLKSRRGIVSPRDLASGQSTGRRSRPSRATSVVYIGGSRGFRKTTAAGRPFDRGYISPY